MTDQERAARHDPIYDRLHATPEFAELRRRYRGFVFPATVAFLAWYLLYVVLSTWATDFMSTQVGRQHQRRTDLRAAPVRDHVRAGVRLLPLLNAKLDPLARQLDAEYRKGGDA